MFYEIFESYIFNNFNSVAKFNDNSSSISYYIRENDTDDFGRYLHCYLTIDKSILESNVPSLDSNMKVNEIYLKYLNTQGIILFKFFDKLTPTVLKVFDKLTIRYDNKYCSNDITFNKGFFIKQIRFKTKILYVCIWNTYYNDTEIYKTVLCNTISELRNVIEQWTTEFDLNE